MMAYDKHQWGLNEPITNIKLNHIEDGIKDLETKIDNIDVDGGQQVDLDIATVADIKRYLGYSS